MKLTDRLEVVANFVDRGEIVADIGTDHGYLSAYLIEENIATKVIATDVNEKPLQKAIDYIKERDLGDHIDTRLGDGLEPILQLEVDICIIAGMGGHLIANIIESSKDISNSIDTFILQPMTGEEELRKYLYENNYKIIDEKLAKEGKRYYHILKVIHDKDVLKDNINLEIGSKLIENKDKLLGELLEKKIETINGIMNKLVMQESKNSKKTYKDFNIRVKKLKEMLKDYES